MSSTEHETPDDYMYRFLLDSVAAYPPVQAVVKTYMDAARLMRAELDARWAQVADLLDEAADLLATPDPFMPHSQMSQDWLERNYRTMLDLAESFSSNEV